MTEMERPKYTTFSEEMHPLWMLLDFALDVQYMPSFKNWSTSKSKIRPNFDIFDPRAKIRGGVSEVSSIIITQGGSIRLPISSSFRATIR